METIPIHKAKTTLSQLIKRAKAGETIYLGSYGKPEVVLMCADAEAEKAKEDARLRAKFFGCMKGRISEADLKALEEPLPQEIIDSFYSMQGLEDFEVKK